jgi:hypothetical protein
VFAGSICLWRTRRWGRRIDAASCVVAYGTFNVVRRAGDEVVSNRLNTAFPLRDCPVCPAAFGPTAPPCGRVCETQQLKLYVGADPGGAGLVDLFLDPDERGRHAGEDDPLFSQMSSPGGPYGLDLRRLSCCIDDWWPTAPAAARSANP